MTGLEVILRPASHQGRLYPRYDDEAGILIAESAVERSWPFGIDIDGRLVFDLDADHTIANFDLHYPKQRWVKDLPAGLEYLAHPHDLAFHSTAVAQKSFHLPLRVRSDAAGTNVLIEIGTFAPDLTVSLSKCCFALLRQSQLVGLCVVLGA